jgi:hypothetical protein
MAIREDGLQALGRIGLDPFAAEACRNRAQSGQRLPIRIEDQ